MGKSSPDNRETMGRFFPSKTMVVFTMKDVFLLVIFPVETNPMIQSHYGNYMVLKMARMEKNDDN